MKEDEKGWWDVPPLKIWICPKCDKNFPVKDWGKCEVDCEDSGSHDGRRCPGCDAVFDHLSGAAEICKGQHMPELVCIADDGRLEVWQEAGAAWWVVSDTFEDGHPKAFWYSTGSPEFWNRIVLGPL